jgi:hypothetical protein
MCYHSRAPAEEEQIGISVSAFNRFIRQVETEKYPTALHLISQRAFIIQHKPPSPAISALHQNPQFKETAFITSPT